MSTREVALLKLLKISHQTVARALGKRRQTITRGLGLETAYLSAPDLKKVADYLEQGDQAHGLLANRDLARRFRDQVKGLSEAGQTAFSPTETNVRQDPRFLEMIASRASLPRPGLEAPPEESPFHKAKELWIFRSRPQETEHLAHLEWMKRWYFDPPKDRVPPAQRLVYFTSPARARQLGRYFLEIFGGLENNETRIHVIIIESSALSIVPDYVIIDPLGDDPQAWAAGQNDYGNLGWIRLAQKNVQLILDNLRGAGIAGLAGKFFVEAFSDDSDDNAPRLTLRFDSRDLEHSREQLTLARSAS